MCGICGVVAARGKEVEIDRQGLERMRDRLTHRGPDSAGVSWALENDGTAYAAFGHRRLAIIDPTESGNQPMTTADGRYTIVYNGELYNDAEVRQALEAEGVPIASSSDTATVLHAVARWDADACGRLRGMYAFALWDDRDRVLLLARDGIGIKPLFWTLKGQRVIFASEIPALFAHPAVVAEPDWEAVSGYVSTVRTTLDDRTMFADVRTVRPGEWIRIECAEPGLSISKTFPAQPGSGLQQGSELGGTESLAAVIEDSVRAHLRSDVPWCSLLSGGLDSTVIAMLAAAEAGSLRTYVSGCPEAGEGLADDFAFAREAADAIGTMHAEVPVNEATFIDRWPAMIAQLGVPMSTPNEVAIHAVADRLRTDGHKVALSGEGADELFAGYELPMLSASTWVAENPDADAAADAAAALDSAAWLTRENKGLFFSPAMQEHAGGDAMLLSWYTTLICEERDAASRHNANADEARVRSFLGLQRRVNLVGLLQRLDTSTMLASVEGRVPFSDAIVLSAARDIGLSDLFTSGDPPGTKLALRRAFVGRVPASIATRPKRSFPLPFQGWLPAMTRRVESSEFLPEVYTREAIAFACAEPSQHWNIAWPMFNLALWAENTFESRTD